MSKYFIRPMCEADIPQVAAIEKLVFPTPWSEHALASELKDNAMAMYLVLVDGQDEDKVLAYGGLWQIFDEGHITNIAVHPDYQGHKLGRFLLHALVSWAWENNLAHMTLEVRPNNTAAIKLYEAVGFRRAGIRPGYYSDTGEDALIMWLHKKETEAERFIDKEKAMAEEKAAAKKRKEEADGTVQG
jgi:ribosomal-protein-alanine N-acetyltransferase